MPVIMFLKYSTGKSCPPSLYTICFFNFQEKQSFFSSQIDENCLTMENLKNELKELAELWNMKQTQMEGAEKLLIDLR